MSQHTPDAWIEYQNEESDDEFWTTDCPNCGKRGDPDKLNDAGLCPSCAKEEPVGLLAVLDQIQRKYNNS